MLARPNGQRQNVARGSEASHLHIWQSFGYMTVAAQMRPAAFKATNFLAHRSLANTRRTLSTAKLKQLTSAAGGGARRPPAVEYRRRRGWRRVSVIRGGNSRDGVLTANALHGLKSLTTGACLLPRVSDEGANAGHSGLGRCLLDAGLPTGPLIPDTGYRPAWSGQGPQAPGGKSDACDGDRREKAVLLTGTTRHARCILT